VVPGTNLSRCGSRTVVSIRHSLRTWVYVQLVKPYRIKVALATFDIAIGETTSTVVDEYTSLETLCSVDTVN
jgi:hypothetical protein